MKDILSVMNILTALFLLYMVECKNVLLIGDSVDRNMVTYWCKKHGIEKDVSTWGNPNIRNGRKSKQPTTFCNNTAGDYFAAVHIFGSSDGPYLWVDTDKFSATSIRMRLSIEAIREIGPLDEVIYNSELWDMRPQYVLQDVEKKFEDDVRSYEKNLSVIEHDTNIRLDELVALIGDTDVKLGLRTSPWSLGYGLAGVGVLFHEYNAMLRRISVAKNLTFYDYDSDLWSAVNYNYSLHNIVFYDVAHPSHMNSLLAGEKIMGSRYSKFYHSNSPQKTNCLYSTLDPSNESVMNLLHKCPLFSISLLCATDSDQGNTGYPNSNSYSNSNSNSNTPYKIGSIGNNTLETIHLDRLYYSDVRNGTRYMWSNLTSAFLLHHRLGAGDVFRVPRNVLDSITTLGTISSETFLTY
jgi:hypothetical protein